MPIEELAEGLFKFLGKFLLQFVVEVVLEILIKGPGYLLTRLFLKKNTDGDGWVTIIVGILFWIVVSVSGYFIYTNLGSGSYQIEYPG